MAKKGQNFTKYTNDFKVKVIKEYLNGDVGRDSLARKYSIPKPSLKNWIDKYQKGGIEELLLDNRGKKATGRPKSKKHDYDSMSDKEKIAYLEMEVSILKKLKAIQKKNQK